MYKRQALLRALQEKRYRPVGGKEEIQTDIRLVAATNEDLEKAIAEGRFREDLFHRLNEFPLHVPLLAECIEDIIPLAEFMLDAANQEFSRKVKGFDREVQKRLKSYSWPGNIRELRMVVRRATLLAKDDWITTGEIDIPDKGRQPGEDTSCPIHNAFMYTSFLLLSIWFISNVLSVYCFRHGTCLYSGRMSGELNLSLIHI